MAKLLIVEQHTALQRGFQILAGMEALGLSQPSLARTFRGVAELTSKISVALQTGPYLLGDSYSAADLLVQSPYAWFKDATPDDPAIRDWVARCGARASVARTMTSDKAMMDQAAAAA